MRTLTGTYLNGRLILDLPFNSNKPLRVTVIVQDERDELDTSSNSPSTDEVDWAHGSAHCLNNAYGDDEPDYSNAVLREPNPKYVP